MLAALASFVVGLFGLVLAGKLVVDAGSGLGLRLGLSPLMVGMTIVAAATSAPELAVVLQAALDDDTELAVGSVVGSNIANIMLVLGVVAAMGSIAVTSQVVRRDIPVMIGATVLFLVLAFDGELGRLDGLLMFSLLVALIVQVYRSSTSTQGPAESIEVTPPKPRPLWMLLGGAAVGVVLLAVGARLVVSGAEEIALGLGIPELIVGLTIVALGTSAPEIVTTVLAALKGQREVAIGNAVGSNIFNLLLVLGLTSLVAPSGVGVSEDLLALDAPIMLAAAIATLPLVAWDRRLDRWEGFGFLLYYAAYVIYLILNATDHDASDDFALVMLVFVAPLTAVTAAILIARSHRASQERKRAQTA